MATAKKPNKIPLKKALDNSYTVRQASTILGLSVKRIRQLINEGKLVKTNQSPVMVEIKSVLALKDQREANPLYRKKSPIDQTEKLVQGFQELLKQLEENNQRAITATVEANQRNEENYLRQIQELRAELERARARRWFKR